MVLANVPPLPVQLSYFMPEQETGEYKWIWIY